MSVLLVDQTPIELRIGSLDDEGSLTRLHHEHPGRGELRLGDVSTARVHTQDARLGGVFCEVATEGGGAQGFLPSKGGKPPPNGSSLLVGITRESIGGKAAQLTASPSLRLPNATVRLEDGGAWPGPLAVSKRAWGDVETSASRLADAVRRGAVLPPLVRALTGMLSADTRDVRVTSATTAATLRSWLDPSGVSVSLYDPAPVRAALDEAEDGALARAVALPGGGRLVIDEAEALTAVDVDLGRQAGQSKKGAAERAASAMFSVLKEQAGLRSLGGQVVVDVPRAAIASPKILRDRLTRALSHRGRVSVPAVTGEGVCVVVAPRPVPSLLERLTEPHGEGVLPGRRLRADVVAARGYRLLEAALLTDRSARPELACPERAAPYLDEALPTLNQRYGGRAALSPSPDEDLHVR